MNDLQQDSYFHQVAEFVREIVGDEAGTTLTISPASVFTDDLEMDSIEIVQFAERIKAHYGERVNLVDWLSTMELDRIIRLSLGEVAGYIRACQP